MLRLKKVISLVNISLVLICIIHVASILNTHLYPLYPDVHVYKANLKDIDFPLSFKICVFDLASNSDAKYQRWGYKRQWDFYLGKSMFNESLHGWNGHGPNGTTLGSTEDMLKNISNNWDDIVERIEVDKVVENGTKISSKLKPRWTLDLLHQCQILDLAEENERMALVQMLITFKPHDDLGISISILDKKTKTRRTVKSLLTHYNGHDFKRSHLYDPRYIQAMLKISQTVSSSRENAVHEHVCQHYPNDEYNSFGDCDEEFVYQRAKNVGLMPFWASKSFDEVTRLTRYIHLLPYCYIQVCLSLLFRYQNDDEFTLPDLLDGTQDSNCLSPCRKTEVFHLKI